MVLLMQRKNHSVLLANIFSLSIIQGYPGMYVFNFQADGGFTDSVFIKTDFQPGSITILSQPNSSVANQVGRFINPVYNNYKRL